MGHDAGGHGGGGGGHVVGGHGGGGVGHDAGGHGGGGGGHVVGGHGDVHVPWFVNVTTVTPVPIVTPTVRFARFGVPPRLSETVIELTAVPAWLASVTVTFEPTTKLAGRRTQ